MDVKVGDRILYAKYSGQEIKIDQDRVHRPLREGRPLQGSSEVMAANRSLLTAEPARAGDLP